MIVQPVVEPMEHYTVLVLSVCLTLSPAAVSTWLTPCGTERLESRARTMCLRTVLRKLGTDEVSRGQAEAAWCEVNKGVNEIFIYCENYREISLTPCQCSPPVHVGEHLVAAAAHPVEGAVGGGEDGEGTARLE